MNEGRKKRASEREMNVEREEEKPKGEKCV